jgi:lipopolysaccharide biosynthesis protein
VVGPWLAGLVRLLRRAYVRIRARLAYLRSFLRARHQVVRMWPEGEVKLSENVALFIHFDRGGQLAEHVLTYLHALNDCRFDVVFVSNSRFRDPDSLDALRPLCRAIIERHNVGYDFGATCEVLGLLAIPRQDTQQLLITNDSVYGPLVPLQDVLGRVNYAVADFWGATESWQHRYHLQSYFLLVGKRVLTSPVWRSFWRGVRQVSSKEWVVSRYEVGLTQTLLRAGLRCRSLWSYYDLIEQTAAIPIPDRDGAESDPLIQMRLKAIARVRHAAARRIPLNPTAELSQDRTVARQPDRCS